MQHIKSYKTTIGGLVVAFGLIMSTIGRALEGHHVGMEEISLVLAALGAAWQGWKSRDDDVTSEGRRIVAAIRKDSTR